MKLSLVQISSSLSLSDVGEALQDLETTQGSVLGIAVCLTDSDQLSVAAIDVTRPRPTKPRTLTLVAADKPKPDGFELISQGTCIASNSGRQVTLYGKRASD